jgi:2'-5' RNA ligase
MKRLFIAIPIEKKWEKIFEKYRDPMGTIEWLRWEPLPKLHISVLFLDATDEELIPEIEDALTDITMAQSPFTLTLEKITYAPEGKKASMIWAKWKEQPKFATLAAQVREDLSYIVGKVDADRAVPHTTLARFNKRVLPPKELIHLRHTEHEGEELQVKEIELIESMMTPTGSVFKTLATFRLNVTVWSMEGAEEEEVIS